MTRKINGKNEDFVGEETFSEITKVRWKNFDLRGSESDDDLILYGLHDGNGNVTNVPNLYYDGKGGTDSLDYQDGPDFALSPYQITEGVQMSVHDGDDWDFYLYGGQTEALSNLEIWTRDVEVFNLTELADSVDMTGTAFAATVYGNGGDDVFTGSQFGDIFYGEAGDDTLDGGLGDDTLSGGDGDDSIDGGEGDDLIVAMGGHDTVMGGAGRDAIYALADLGDVDGLMDVWGDDEGALNEADTFFLTYDTTSEPTYETWTTTSGGWDWGEAGLMTAQAAIGSLPGGNAVNLGIDLFQLANSKTVETGIDMTSSGGSVLSGGVFIRDFDAWGDTAVVALDEYADQIDHDVAPSVGLNADVLNVSLLGENFLDIALAETNLSFMGADEDVIDIGTASEGILNNLFLNAMKVYEVDGEVRVESMNGLDLTGEIGAADIEGLFDGTVGDDGVLLIGDYGASTLFGHSMDLAGSNSDNVMYSGDYKDSAPMVDGEGYDAALWISNLAVDMIGGLGNDVIFGSTAGGDRLFGGGDNDYLLAAGADGGIDTLYGGGGEDFASFEDLYHDGANIGGYSYEDGNVTVQTGVLIDMSAGEAFGLDATQWQRSWSAWNTNESADFLVGASAGHYHGDKVAELDGIEGVVGTDQPDVLYGGGGDDTLHGGAELDHLVGGAGDDRLFGGLGGDRHWGGEGADTFVFEGGTTTGDWQWFERIHDFEVGVDTIEFDGTKDRAFSQLSFRDNSDGVVVNYGDGSIALYDVTSSELSASDFVFV